MPESPQRPNPRALLRIWGGDGEGDGEGTTKSDDPNGSGSGDGDSDAKLADFEAKLKAAEERAEKAEKSAKELDKKSKDAEKQLADKAKEGMEENERNAAERDEFKEKYEKLLEFVETSYVDTAIMQLSAKSTKDGKPTYQWHDPMAVRAFIDRDAIQMDMDTGNIEGLEAQLKDLAKSKPWLLVPQQQEGGGPPPPPGGPATGSHPRGSSTFSRETDANKLRQKYKMPGYQATLSRPQ